MMRKKQEKAKWQALDLVCTPYGSLIKTYQILNGIEMSNTDFVKLFRKARFPFLDNKDFIQLTLQAVGYDIGLLKYKPVAVCSNENNTIFCPFIFGNDEVVLLPLFKDGKLLHSQEIAMANDSYQIIDWRELDSEDELVSKAEQSL